MILVKRWTAIVAFLALGILTLSVCCTSAPLAMEQHGCCKGRCASMSASAPLAIVMPTITAGPAVALRPVAVTVALPSLSAANARLFPPILTVQLRI